MIDNYPKQAKHCTYAAGTFCPPGHGCVETLCVSKIQVPVLNTSFDLWAKCIGFQAESISVRNSFDTIVLMNVLEHCQGGCAATAV